MPTQVEPNPALLTIPAILESAAHRWPKKVAVVENNQVTTFKQLHQRARALAKAFIAHGLASGDRFAIWAPNSTLWQIIALAGQLAGCVLVPLNTRYRQAEVRDILERSESRAVFHIESFLGTDYKAMLSSLDGVQVSQVALSELDNWAQAGQAITDSELEKRISKVTESSLADILFTSGTTGLPKGVMCSHGQNIRVFQTWARGVTLSSDDEYLIVNPYFHSFGYKAGWLAALIQGATVYPVAVFDIDQVLALIQQHGITFLPGAPTIFQSLLGHPQQDTYDLSTLRCAVTGAASIPVQLVKDMKHLLEFQEVYTAYGLTESTGVVSLCQSGDDFETIANTSGRPMKDVQVQITDSAGLPLGPGLAGEIWVRGFNVMQGYLDDPAATRQAITPEGWLKTGDIGIQDEYGYLRITDRIKDMYICGGFNCYPAEIENSLLEHPDIADVAVLGAPDERLGEVGYAFIVAREGAKPDSAELIAWCRGQIANFKAPRHISFIETLPRNASGKVQKYLLKQQMEVS